MTGEGYVRSDPAGIDCGQTCDATFATGVSARLVATARAGSTFDGWSGDCSGTDDCVLPGAGDASHMVHVSAKFVAVPPPPPPPPPDECAGLMPSSLPAPVTAVLTYQRFDAGGRPVSNEVRLDRTTRMAGVDLDGNALLASFAAGKWQGRWLARDATPLTWWFDLPAPSALDPLVEGGLAVRSDSNYVGVIPDGEARQTGLPDWLDSRASTKFASIRQGKAYASWASGSTCGPGSIEIVVPSTRKSCGCLSVPDFSPSGSIGVDGSVIVPQPAPQNGKCAYSLYPQLLR